MFKKKHSLHFLKCLYATLKIFVYKFPMTVFSPNHGYCKELCTTTLLHCNFQNTSLRSIASAFMYFLMERNFKYAKNFSLVKVQTTIALSKLIGEGLIKEPAYLRLALGSINRYATSLLSSRLSSTMAQALITEIEALVERLTNVLKDSTEILLVSTDPYTRVDIYYRLAESYINVPDLRVTWLDNLAEFHRKQKAYAEAAQCTIHIAALITEYLNIQEPSPGIPTGCNSFQTVSRSALEEASLVDVAIDDGSCNSGPFTETGLLEVMDKAIGFLKRAKLYETANEMYKLLIPIYEKNRDYAKLADCHGDLQTIYDQIILVSESSSRLFECYYRVGFYGPDFEELNGKEFIYKEPPLTKLGEITESLTHIFNKKHPNIDLKIITNSADVNPKELNPTGNYLQITAVKPYFEAWELKERVTAYDKNYNINQFIFETPFSKDGKSHAESIANQYKRKTILRTRTAFPYIKKRIEVINKQTIEVQPIENALELIEQRTESLMAELKVSSPNIKTLQPVLQGAVRVSVNAGPLDIAKSFLGNPAKYDSRQIENLRMSLEKFLDICGEALQLNKELTSRDQWEFHLELEEGYLKMKEEMLLLINAQQAPSSGNTGSKPPD
eukprot:TRINITY_DN4009_c0_g1_i1.p1 TRINITY_DN4009_c0_g1~~TRINITY_DN4009_c0_g1_i1.p1  ORF type:complete len:676 (+),score=104.11 TRINITY_DN4009_c0_g1_i1:186-2030(+)